MRLPRNGVVMSEWTIGKACQVLSVGCAVILFCHIRFTAQDRLLDRPWFDHLPKNDRDDVRVYYFSDARGSSRDWHVSYYNTGMYPLKYQCEKLLVRFDKDNLTMYSPLEHTADECVFRITESSDRQILKLEIDEDPHSDYKTGVYFSKTGNK